MLAKIKEYINAVKLEGSKIQWTTPSDAAKATMIVVGAAIIMSLFFLLIDAVAYKIIKILLGIN